ncbi:GNAT family N-acetyltransferase [Tumebacillus lipolyticus]|uniref:GNAT family N-acetyltransferase n=1 Tax=Tumebacillus lipolyticus TaxID=1280370 RepID=A0ABW4ZTZ4_9BACL
MDRVTFRQGARADWKGMSELFTKRPVKERLARMKRRYEKEPEGWYVAEQSGRIIGCCQAVFPRPADCWLQWMRIGKQAQGGGIGGSFVDYIERQVIARGAEAVRLNTMITNRVVHSMMGGSRGFTEWARWTRFTDLPRRRIKGKSGLRSVRHAEDAAEVIDWLEGQVGYRASFAAVTCPHDFQKTVSLDRALLKELIGSRERAGCVIAEKGDQIEAVALYRGNGRELRILQLVAASNAGGVAAVGRALQEAKQVERMSIQLAGASQELLGAIQRSFVGPKGKQHDFYVFGKRF